MKRVLFIVAAILAAFLIQSLLAIATGDPWASLGLTAMLAVFCFAVYRYPEQTKQRRWLLVPATLALAAVIMTATASAFSGGIRVSPESGPYRFCSTINIWHTGHAPVGGYVAYRGPWLRVHVCRNFGNSIVSLGYSTTWKNEVAPVDIIGITERVTKRYDCKIGYYWVHNGCAYFFRKGKVRYDYPFMGGIVTAYPWVKLRVEGDDRSPVRSWAWSTGIF